MEKITHADFINILKNLEKSKFRSRFKLNAQLKQYVSSKGIETIKKHAYDLIGKRLAPQYIANDGNQTPMKGHPVFIAQHATATCCRGCLYKWHHIDKNKELTSSEIDYVVNLIMYWIERQMQE